jgi:hypothetical protein
MPIPVAGMRIAGSYVGPAAGFTDPFTSCHRKIGQEGPRGSQAGAARPFGQVMTLSE